MPTRIRTDLGPGTPPALPFGAILRAQGVEFVLFSRHAIGVSILLYDRPEEEPAEEIVLDPVRNRRGDLWYAFVPDCKAGQIYAFKVHGPNDPNKGHRFDASLALVDPWARAFTTNAPDASQTISPFRQSNRSRPKSIVIDDQFDWQHVANPHHKRSDTVIYEMHVRGFTKHPSSNCEHPGSYLGVIEKIPYLKELGVTAIELLPIQEFDYLELGRKNPETSEILPNYWGYSPYGFFAPAGRYATSNELAAQVTEFKTMVRELHRAGIEVILDVVYNHTGELDSKGSTINFRGLDNSIYYFLNGKNDEYIDFSGCGNSLNSNHPVVRAMILNSLRYWATHMEVDGFRFDLASVLSRDRKGNLVSDPPVLDGIAEDPILRDVKIIAEAWDAVGAYQVGSFSGGRRWSEWNGKYRDDMRQYWRGDAGKTGAFATRLMGSSDLYHASGKEPMQSINFITCHDGFTLNDLVSYTKKRNLQNGENNRDGDNNNNSANYGVEGITTDPEIEAIRIRQIKNFFATLFFSQGVPMMLGGDEFRRTQRGNNNAYCQDNEISWFDWTLLDQNRDLFRFCQSLIAFRKAHPVLRRSEFFSGARKENRKLQDVEWFGLDGKTKIWEVDDGSLACILDGTVSAGLNDPEDDDILMLFNASIEPKNFSLPVGEYADRPWRLFVDTSKPSPADIYPENDGPKFLPGAKFTLVPRSLACFVRPSTN